MFNEHYDGGMIEKESRDDDFLENKISSIYEMKEDLKLHELVEASKQIISSLVDEYVSLLLEERCATYWGCSLR